MLLKLILSLMLSLGSGASSSVLATEFDSPIECPNNELSRDDKKLFVQKLENFGIKDLCSQKIIDEGKLKLTSKLFYFTPHQQNEVLKIISQMTWLTSLNLSHNQLQSVPESLGNLTHLKKLSLYNNLLQSVPESLGKLVLLRELHLTFNQLQSVPESLGNLTQLIELWLSDNQLLNIPSSLGNLVHLQWLSLSHNQLQSVPESLGNLRQLIRLYFDNNQLQSVPASLGRIRILTLLDLRDNPHLLPRGESEQLWGREELRHHFGDRVVLKLTKAILMTSYVTAQSVYRELDQQDTRIGRDVFHATKLPEITVKCPFSGHVMLDYLGRIVSSLNLSDETTPGYLSYETLASDFVRDAHGHSLSNFEKIQYLLLPRLKGYIKTLYDLPLEEGEVKGWKMYEGQVAETKKVLNFIIEKIFLESDKDIQAIWFLQLVNGLLHCPTGQAEAINAVAYAMFEGNYKNRELSALIDHHLANKKNVAFNQVISAQSGDDEQNVHLISTYRDRLKNELGLTAAIQSYNERIGIIGHDPFSGNEWYVVQVFYKLVTPERLIYWIQEAAETPSDRLDSEMLRRIEELCFCKPQRNHSAIHKSLKSIDDKLRDTNLNETERDELNHKKILITNLLTNQEKAQTQPKALPEDILNYFKLQDFKLSEKEISGQDLILVRMYLKKKVQHNQQFRPFSVGNFCSYLIDEKLLTREEVNGWARYFTSDPEKDRQVTITWEGIKAILVHKGYIIKD